MEAPLAKRHTFLGPRIYLGVERPAPPNCRESFEYNAPAFGAGR